MITEVIVAITALLSATLGAAIPSVSGLADRRMNQKNNRKERYEAVIRDVLSEYFPRMESCLYIAKNYQTGTRRETMAFELELLEETITFYEEKLIKELPLDITEDMADLHFSLGFIRREINMDLDNYSNIDADFKSEVNKAEIKLKKLKETIKKKYI